MLYKSTWSYENRVSKHFFLNFSFSNSLFAVLFAYVVFFWLVLWFGICVEVDVDRITILPPLPIFFATNNSFFNTSDSYQFEISGRLNLVSVPFSSLVLDIGHLEKSHPESIM